jgi:hypothetical protein
MDDTFQDLGLLAKSLNIKRGFFYVYVHGVRVPLDFSAEPTSAIDTAHSKNAGIFFRNLHSASLNYHTAGV